MVTSLVGATLLLVCLTLYVRMVITTTGVNAIAITLQSFASLLGPQK